MLLYILLLLLSMIWGMSFLFIKIGVEVFQPYTVAFLRSLFGLVTLSLIMLVFKKKLAFKGLPWLPLISVAVFNSSIPWILIAYSETQIASGFAAVLNATTPLWTIIIGIVIFKARQHWAQWIGILIGFIGVCILTNFKLSLQLDHLLPIITMLLATLCYGLATQLSRHKLQQTDVFTISWYTLLVGAISSGIMAVPLEQVSMLQVFEPLLFLSFIGLGAIGSGVAYIIYFYLIQKGSAEFAAFVTYIVPFFALMWGYFLLSEPLSWSVLAGLLLILGGVFISTRAQLIEKLTKLKAAKHQQDLTETQSKGV